MRPREGDLIQTGNKIIFDVKGLIHPPSRVIAFPRYIPSHEGKRGKGANLYAKVYNLAERFQYLQQNTPSFLVDDPVFGDILCEVPENQITEHYTPIEKLAELREKRQLADLERKAVVLAETLKEAADIPWESVGVSGSIMAGLFTLQSDIDPLVYGAENCRKAYLALKTMLKDGNSQPKPYTREELHSLFDFRSKDTMMSFDDFERVEGSKAFQGKFEGVDFFVRFVKDWNEIDEKYGDVVFKNMGYAKITATVTNASEALFTPCTYKLENANVLEGPAIEPVAEIVSFRGRFCEQVPSDATEPTTIEAQGKVELVKDKRSNREFYRLILGNKPQDYMILSRC